MDKAELLDTLDNSREQFLESVEGLDDDEMQAPGVAGDWSVKDILVHLSMWEAELVRMLWQVKQNEKPTTVQFTNTDLDATNAAWYQKNRSRPLERALEDFHAVRNQTMHRLEAFIDRDLTDPNRFTWLKGKPLFEWIAADTYEHENEHASQIRAWRQARPPQTGEQQPEEPSL
jgi:hypothetical protein